MYGGGDYDGGAAAFMGGGFMSSQSQAPDSIVSPSKNRETRCLFPLTVKQICNLASNDESNFVIDGVEVNNVSIVGRVCQKEDKVSESTFLIDDGTGLIECTKWVQERVDPDEISEILVGSYVRVHGQLRGLQGRRFLNVFSIKIVSDYNEIICHFIECIYVHQHNTRTRSADGPLHMLNSPMNTPLKGYQGASGNHASSFYNTDGLNKVGQAILNFLQQPIHLVRHEMALRDGEDGKEENFSSLDKLDPSFYLKIISRNSIDGHSNLPKFPHGYGVPFVWEAKPGKPKDMPKDEIECPMRSPLKLNGQDFAPLHESSGSQSPKSHLLNKYIKKLTTSNPSHSYFRSKSHLMKTFKVKIIDNFHF